MDVFSLSLVGRDPAILKKQTNKKPPKKPPTEIKTKKNESKDRLQVLAVKGTSYEVSPY